MQGPLNCRSDTASASPDMPSIGNKVPELICPKCPCPAGDDIIAASASATAVVHLSRMQRSPSDRLFYHVFCQLINGGAKRWLHHFSIQNFKRGPHSTAESRLACLCHICSVTPVLSGDLDILCSCLQLALICSQDTAQSPHDWARVLSPGHQISRLRAIRKHTCAGRDLLSRNVKLQVSLTCFSCSLRIGLLGGHLDGATHIKKLRRPRKPNL